MFKKYHQVNKLKQQQQQQQKPKGKKKGVGGGGGGGGGGYIYIYMNCGSNWLFSILFIQALEEKEKGNAAYKQKDFATALKHYEKALELDPTNITILTNRAGRSKQ